MVGTVDDVVQLAIGISSTDTTGPVILYIDNITVSGPPFGPPFPTAQEISVTTSELGLKNGTCCYAENLWTDEKFSFNQTLSATVPSNGIALFRVSYECKCGLKNRCKVCPSCVNPNFFQLATTFDNAVNNVPMFINFGSPVTVSLTPPPSYSQNTTPGIFRLHIDNNSLPEYLQDNNLNLYYQSYLGESAPYPTPFVSAGGSVNNLSPAQAPAFVGGGNDDYGPYWDFDISFFSYIDCIDWQFVFKFVDAITFITNNYNAGIPKSISDVLIAEETGDVFVSVAAGNSQTFTNVTRSNTVTIDPYPDINAPEYAIYPNVSLSTLAWKSGDSIIYNNEGNGDIPGLVSGTTYYLIVPKIPLAQTKQ